MIVYNFTTRFPAGGQKMTKSYGLTARYLTVKDEVSPLISLEKKTFKDPSNHWTHENQEHIKKWLKKSTNAICVLECLSNEIQAYFRFLPISKRCYNEMLSNQGKDIREYLKRDDYVLSDRQTNDNVGKGYGNYCYVGMIAYDPDKLTENYDDNPLFGLLSSNFRRTWMKGLVCQSESAPAAKVIAEAGCRQVMTIGKTIDGDRVVWCFDRQRKAQAPTTGLSVIFNELWVSDRYKSRLKLSPREKQIVRLTSDGLSDKKIANALFIAADTVRTHWDNVRKKLSNLQIRDHVTRGDIISYCSENGDELAMPYKEDTER